MTSTVKYLLAIVLLCFVFTVSCKKKQVNRAPQECIEYILKEDDSLGKVRNQACKKISLSKTIHQYTSDLNKTRFFKLS